MGFWEEKYKNKKIFVSDDGLDICYDVIEDFYVVFFE